MDWINFIAWIMTFGFGMACGWVLWGDPQQEAPNTERQPNPPAETAPPSSPPHYCHVRTVEYPGKVARSGHACCGGQLDLGDLVKPGALVVKETGHWY